MITPGNNLTAPFRLIYINMLFLYYKILFMHLMLYGVKGAFFPHLLYWQKEFRLCTLGINWTQQTFEKSGTKNLLKNQILPIVTKYFLPSITM